MDFKKGIISFGENKYPLQFIGSEADSSQDWMWGWNNINNFSDEVLKMVDEVRNIGENWNSESLIIPTMELNDIINGHNLSIIACGLFKNICYYPGKHSGGTVFIGFLDVPEKVFEQINSQRFVSITMECIQEFGINHRVFVESLLSSNKIGYVWNKDALIADFEHEVKIDFERVEGKLRIKRINSGFSGE